MSQSLASIDRVEIFSVGVHHGTAYTESDLDQVIANFQLLSAGSVPVLQPPVVLGHEQHQELLARSDLPAAGWVKRIWREGGTLLADIGDVPTAVAQLINQKTYRKVSIELYEDFRYDGRSYGRVLRRVALLGGQLPELKSLADLPLAAFVAMQPYRVISWSSDSFRGVVGGELEPPHTRNSGAPRNESDLFPSQFSENRMNRDEMLSVLQVAGFDRALLEKLDPDELSEVHRVQLSRRDFHEVETQIRTLEERQRVLDQQLAEKEVDAKRSRIQLFSERMLREGKITPAELDGSARDRHGNPIPNLLDRLQRADARQSIHTFKEGTKEVPMTELDLQMAEIEARPPLRFAERLRQSADRSHDDNARVAAHYDQFSEDFRKAGITREKYLATFERNRDQVSADAYIHGRK